MDVLYQNWLADKTDTNLKALYDGLVDKGDADDMMMSQLAFEKIVKIML